MSKGRKNKILCWAKTAVAPEPQSTSPISIDLFFKKLISPSSLSLKIRKRIYTVCVHV